MAWLQQAIAAGYDNVALMKKDSDLDSLRDRADFQKLLAEQEARGARSKGAPPPCASEGRWPRTVADAQPVHSIAHLDVALFEICPERGKQISPCDALGRRSETNSHGARAAPNGMRWRSAFFHESLSSFISYSAKDTPFAERL